mmetsp:Transcript_76322/g.205117  ORF Transcript_76322/g.205117 Transcript_76322/m.205117 type:complete len:272 (+) Transcript_76322:344-1159(+)
MQSAATERGGAWSIAKIIAKQEGVRGFWRGTSAGIVHALPSISIYLTLYEQLKSFMDGDKSIHASFRPPVAGAAARTLAVLVTCPLEVVRTRLTIPSTSSMGQSGVIHSLNNLFREAGFRSLWTGITPMLYRDVPFSALYWSVAEATRTYLQTSPLVHDAQWLSSQTHSLQRRDSHMASSLSINLVSGVVAGAVASVATHPFDLVKTRVMLHDDGRGVGTYARIRDLVEVEGVNALWKGLAPRLMKVVPSCAIVLASFEFFKEIFSSPNKC